MLALHLLQVSLVFINTAMIQCVLGSPTWVNRLTTPKPWSRAGKTGIDAPV
jgi:TnpA family transposase